MGYQRNIVLAIAFKIEKDLVDGLPKEYSDGKDVYSLQDLGRKKEERKGG